MQAVGKIPCKNFSGTWLPLLLHSNEVNQPIKLILYLRKIIGFSVDLLTAQLATGPGCRISVAARLKKIWRDVFLFRTHVQSW